VRCLDTTFLIDLLKGDAEARRKAREWHESGEALSTPAPAVAEVLLGAYFRGGTYLRDALSMTATLTVLEVDAAVATEAGRLGAELLRHGQAASLADLLIAACAKVRQHILVTRDEGFARIPGLVLESY